MNLHVYHDTGAAPTVNLAEYRAQAASQDQEILTLFRLAPAGFETSPSKLADAFPQWPITSIRRALTNLTKRGELEKAPRMVQGAYGRPEHVWRLVRGQGRLF